MNALAKGATEAANFLEEAYGFVGRPAILASVSDIQLGRSGTQKDAERKDVAVSAYSEIDNCTPIIRVDSVKDGLYRVTFK